MFGLFKKKEKVFIPDGMLMEILEAWDDYTSNQESTVARCKFWSLVEETFPEVGEGVWRFDTERATKPFFERVS